MKRLFFIVITILAISQVAYGQAPVEKSLKYRGHLFSYYSNIDLFRPSEKIDRVLIIVHGSARNADTYYKTMRYVANKTDNKENTIIISPHYKDGADQLNYSELAWFGMDWWVGNDAANAKKISSFDIIDNFINIVTVKDRFPNIEQIVITGHSAGGQVTQRYALGSNIEDKLPEIKFRYIVANPGTYIYMTPRRPVLDGSGKFRIPNVSCRYNDYKFGLKHLNRYVAKADRDELVSRYIQRDVTYLVGQNDTSTNIEQTCGARVQGKNRLERGKNIMAHINYEFPDNNHQFKMVPEIGHTQWGMYRSEVGMDLLF